MGVVLTPHLKKKPNPHASCKIRHTAETGVFQLSRPDGGDRATANGGWGLVARVKNCQEADIFLCCSGRRFAFTAEGIISSPFFSPKDDTIHRFHTSPVAAAVSDTIC